MRLRYFRGQLIVVGVFYVLHALLVVRGFSHVGLLAGFLFSLVPLLGPWAGFLYLVKPEDIAGVLAIALQILLFALMMAAHPLLRTRWAAVISAAGALLWCCSGFFYLYALAT